MSGQVTAEEALKPFLIVEDDQGIARTIARTVRARFRPVIAHSASNAREVIASGEPFSAAVVDIGLPDGSGLEVVRALREQNAEVPVMVLTGKNAPEIINRAHLLGAEFVCKPWFLDNLKTFLQRVVTETMEIEDAFRDSVRRVAADRGLTMRETEILGLATSGIPRQRLAGVLGVSENTVKTHIRSLLDKTNHSSLSDAVWTVRSSRDQPREGDEPGGTPAQ